MHALQVNKTAVTNSETKSSHKLISGYWVGILDLQSLKGSIRNLNLTNGERIVIVDHNGSAIVDYFSSPPDVNNNNNNNNSAYSSKLEDFGYLNAAKSVRNGNAGSASETVNGTKKLLIYQPIQVGNRFWGVILIKLVTDLI